MAALQGVPVVLDPRVALYPWLSRFMLIVTSTSFPL